MAYQPAQIETGKMTMSWIFETKPSWNRPRIAGVRAEPVTVNNRLNPPNSAPTQACRLCNGC